MNYLPLLLSIQRSKKAGFTLIEVLVVVLIIGVLSSIAAPGWLGFMETQRLKGANTEVLQLLRKAQTQAIAKRNTQRVRLVGSNRLRWEKEDGTVIDTVAIGSTDAGSISISLLPAAINNVLVFDFRGAVAEEQRGALDALLQANPNARGFRVLVRPNRPNQANNVPIPQRCVIVQTLLGAMVEGKNTDCN